MLGRAGPSIFQNFNLVVDLIVRLDDIVEFSQIYHSFSVFSLGTFSREPQDGRSLCCQTATDNHEYNCVLRKVSQILSIKEDDIK